MLNLTAATGNQIQVMDLGFALQAHSLRELARDPTGFADGPQPVPLDVVRDHLPTNRIRFGFFELPAQDADAIWRLLPS